MGIDVALAEWLNGIARSAVVRPAAVWVANEFAVVVVVTLVLGGFALAGRDLLRQRRLSFGLVEGAAVALLALMVGLIVNHGIGAAWFRPRPYDAINSLHLLAAPSGDPSFPSDHATAAFSLALGIGVASPRLCAVLLLEAIVLGTARVAVGLHYPTDIAAGLFVALAAVGVASQVVFAARRPLGRAVTSTIGRLVPVGPPTPGAQGHQLALLSAGLFAVLLGMPIVVEAASDPIHFQPEWLEGVVLVGTGLGLATVWLTVTKLANHWYLRAC